MSQKLELNEEDEKDILNKLPPELFERAYREVLSKVEAESCYKSLKNMGKNEIFNTIEFPDQDLAQKERMARFVYSRIRVLATGIDDIIQNIVKEQFENPSFRNEVQEEVLKCIKEKLSSDTDVKMEIKEKTEEEEKDFDKASKNPQDTAQKSLPIHMQKHNEKNASEDVSSFSVKQKETEKILMNRSSAKIRSVPRKVGIGYKKGKAP